MKTPIVGRSASAVLFAALLLPAAHAADPPGILTVKSGLLAHFDASKGAVAANGLPPASGARIVRWGDQGLDVQGDNTALPASGGIGPFYLNSVPELNGRPALDFRNGELLTSTLSLDVSQSTWFVVFRATFAAEDRVIEFANEASTFVTPEGGGRVVARGWRVTGGSFPIDATLSNLSSRKQEFFIQSVRRQMPSEGIDQRLIDRNGAVLTASGTGANSTRVQSLLAIGGQRPTGTIPYPGLLTGQIAEVLVYNRTLTNAERLSVEGYLSWKYFGPADTDGDFLPDEWEQQYFGSLTNNPDDDPDGDLLTNRQEFEAGSDPLKADTDGDGLDDAREVAAGTSPIKADTDGDLASDALELLAGTDPKLASSKPAALFTGLRIHSDMEAGDPSQYRIRNLAGPGDATTNDVVVQSTGIVGKGVHVGAGALDYGVREEAATGAFTVSLAFRSEENQGVHYLASQGNRDATRPGWSIFLEDGVPVIRTMNGARTTPLRYRHTGALEAGSWHVIGFTRQSDGTLVPYLDGSSEGWQSPAPANLVASLAATGDGDLTPGDGSPLLLGLSSDSTFAYVGALDEFSLWSRALSPEEIGGLHQQILTGRGLDGLLRTGAPAFTAEPQPAFAFFGQSVTLSAEAPGATLQWKKNGGALSGQTSTSLVIEKVGASDGGRYQVVASGSSASQPSAEALVRTAEFKVGQSFKTRGGATRELEFQVQSIAVDGDSMVAGTPSHRYNTQEVQLGLVRCFRRSATAPDTWNLSQVIVPPAGDGLYFGNAVAMQRDTLIVSAYGSSSFGDPRFGRVFVYTRSNANSSWTLRQEIQSPIREDNDAFGVTVSLDGDTLAIGSGVSKAFVYSRSRGGSTWTLLKTLPSPKPDYRTGGVSGLSLKGNLLIVGESTSSDSSDNLSGAAYLYRRDQGGTGQWGLVQKLRAPKSVNQDLFGTDASIDGNTLAISNPGAQTIEVYSLDPATGAATRQTSLPRPLTPGVQDGSNNRFARSVVVQGDCILSSDPYSSDRGSGAGAVFLYRRDPGSLSRWTLLGRFTGDDVLPGSQVGTALAMQGNEIVAAASEDNHPERVGSLYGFRIRRDRVPNFSNPPVTLADTGEAYRWEIDARTATLDAPALSFIGTLPSWLTFQDLGDGRALLTGSPPAGTIDPVPVRIRAQETWSLPAELAFTLHVMPGNLPPSIVRARLDLEAPEDTPAIEADLSDLFADGEDPIGDLSFEIVSGLSEELFASSSSSNGILSLVPQPNANGPADLVIRATDRGGLYAEAAIHIEVLPVNDPPEAAPLPTLTADAAANPISRSLAEFFSDPDIGREGDHLGFEIVGNTAPELFTTAAIDLETAELSLAFAAYRSGEADLRIRVTDSLGETAEGILHVIVPPIPPPSFNLTTALTLNRQTGLYEQTLTLTNNGARALGGFDLTISGLPAGTVVINGSSTTDGVGSIRLRQPLGVGESIKIVVQYFVPARGATFTPEITATVTLPEAPPASPGDGFVIERALKLADGGFLIEFASVPGHRYEVQYSDDGTQWLASPIPIQAAGTRLQWIDRGPPFTTKAPAVSPRRFYRVKDITAP